MSEDIKPGNIVKVTLPGGWWFRGRVVIATFWDERSRWYLEVDVDEVAWLLLGRIGSGCGYKYWKQGSDGGSVEVLDAGAAIPEACLCPICKRYMYLRCGEERKAPRHADETRRCIYRCQEEAEARRR